MAALTAVYLFELNPWGVKQYFPPIDESKLRSLPALEEDLRKAGRKLERPLQELVQSTQGRDVLFGEGRALEDEREGPLAVVLYQRLTWVGHGKSAKRLAEIYHSGILGVPRDLMESQIWAVRAQDLGERFDWHRH